MERIRPAFRRGRKSWACAMSIRLWWQLPILRFRTWFDQAADPMFSVFSSRHDPTPYNVLKNQIPLNEMNPPIAALHGLRREMAIASTKMNFTEPDAAPEDLLNHVVWWSVKGYDKP